MAKKKAKTIDVSGMSIQEIMNIDLNTFNKMTERDLRAVTSRLVSAANKRVRSLEKHDLTTPALTKLGDVRYFSTKDANKADVTQKVNRLKHEFARARNFLSSRTSTIKGYNQYLKDARDRFEEETGASLSNSQIGRLYDVLHKMQQAGLVGGRGTEGSAKARELIINNIEELDEDTLMERVTEEYTEYYEERETEDTDIW